MAHVSHMCKRQQRSSHAEDPGPAGSCKSNAIQCEWAVEDVHVRRLSFGFVRWVERAETQGVVLVLAGDGRARVQAFQSSALHASNPPLAKGTMGSAVHSQGQPLD